MEVKQNFLLPKQNYSKLINEYDDLKAKLIDDALLSIIFYYRICNNLIISGSFLNTRHFRSR